MALIRCPECKAEISDEIESCPECGYPIVELTKTTNEDIEEKIKGFDFVDKWLIKGETKELPNILLGDEKVKIIIRGNHGICVGILVATNKRLIFVSKNLGDLTVEDFSYDKISSVQYQTGLVSRQIAIFCTGSKAYIKGVDENPARNFCEYVSARIASTEKPAGLKKPSKIGREGLVVELEQLVKLKQQKILSDEEFQIAKKKLLE